MISRNDILLTFDDSYALAYQFLLNYPNFPRLLKFRNSKCIALKLLRG